MDGWQAVQNWTIFAVLAGGAVWYYYPQAKKNEKPQEKIKAREQPVASKQPKHHHAKRSEKSDAKGASVTPTTTSQAPTSNEAHDDNALNFAEQMMKARKGTTLKSSDKADTRVKTVKQGNALRTSAESAAPAQKEIDDISFATSTATSGGVADMLEPVAPGPSSLRIAPSQQPVKEKPPKSAKKEEAETKKQRQNRLKNEAKKQQREEEEKERKALEERQRRSAREARGEPAKNGVPVSKPPASNAWSEGNSSSKPVSAAAPNGALLDTFDVESTGSSNAGASTAATSTTEANPSRWTEDLPSEEDQIAAFKAQDDGWNEVKSTKKQKKKPSGDSNGTSTPVAAPPVGNNHKPAAPVGKPLVNGKPIGFQALHDELDQNAGFDPNDASSWAA